MHLLASREQGDEVRDALLARFHLLRRLHAPKHRVPAARIQRQEERRRPSIVRKCRLQIGWHRRAARRVIGQVPAPILLGAFDLREPRRLHRASLDQLQRFFTVDLGPHAFCAPRRELLEPRNLVCTLLLAINPAPHKRHLDRLGVRNRHCPRCLLGEPQPDAT